jgi:hypothetical protein
MMRFVAPIVAAAALALAGCNALVGGRCADGLIWNGSECADPGAGAQGGGGSHDDPATGGAAGSGPTCSADTAFCAGGCVDLDVDPSHCGTCGVHCATEMCEAGQCVGDPVGHLMVIGMSYEATNAASERVLGNAVFRTNHDPLRVATYERHAVDTAITSVHAALRRQAALRHRRYRVTAISPTAPTAAMGNGAYDVLLILDQARAHNDTLGSVGSALEPVIADFASRGGTVVALASHDGSGQMCDFLTASGLLACSSLEPAAGMVHNVIPTDVLGNGVLAPFEAPDLSTAFVLPTFDQSDQGAVVLASDGGLPLAVHRVTSAQ